MNTKTFGLITLLAFSFLSPTSAQVEKGFIEKGWKEKHFNSIIVELEPPPRNGFLIDFNCDFAWMGGEARSATNSFAPGIFVYSKSHARWLQVLQVSTADARFGKSPPEALIQAPWDFTRLASKDFVSLPIKSGGAMHYPDRVSLNQARDAFILYLDSNWQMDHHTFESARTLLLIPKKHLLEAFDYYSGSTNAQQPTSEKENRREPTHAGAGVDKPLTNQIADALKECQTIKPGMTRAELSRIFTTEGDLSTARHRTYVYHACPYIKVDVEFTPSAPKQDEERPTDVITKISKPYLDWSIRD